MVEEASGHDGAEWALGLDDPAAARAVAQLDAMVARRRAGRAVAVRARLVGLPPARPDGRPAGADPATRDRAGRRGGPGRCVRLACRGRSWWSTSAPARVPSPCRWPTSSPLTGVEIWATDVSPDALDVARANLAGLGRPGRTCGWRQGSGSTPLPPELAGGRRPGRVQPALRGRRRPQLEASVRDWEPAVGPARRAGRARRRPRSLVAGVPAWLRPGGWLVAGDRRRSGCPGRRPGRGGRPGGRGGPARPRRPRPGAGEVG